MRNVTEGVTLADIFRSYGQDYIQEKKPTPAQCKVIRAVSRCRTEALGADLYRCPSCGYEHVIFHSCPNRHCPVCQFMAREKWLAARKKELLPVPYFHVVFTLPDLLNSLILANPKAFYDLLFKAASQTILKLAADKKHIGGQGGLLAILHTWGQNLSFHPHLHCVVPGGALSFDGNRWLYPKKSKRKKKFFVHVNILSQLFRNIFLHHLKKLYLKGKLRSALSKSAFNDLIGLYKIQWVTYCKAPFGGAAQVLDYLGRYTHRVAISNRRIMAVENDEVAFSWRDYKDHNKNKIMSLPVIEFMRRFLLHVLPKGYFKIRYYGILCSRNKKSGLARVQRLLVHYGNSDKVCGETKLSFKPQLCPHCKKGLMEVLKTIPRRFFLNNRSP